MWIKRFGGSIWIILLAVLIWIPAAKAEGPAKAFAFSSSQYMITAEVASARGFVLNFINLSDFVIVVQPNEFIYKGASGRFYIGQVFEQEHKDNRGEVFRYSASILIKGQSFTGLNILGAFQELDQIEELSIRIGAKRFYLVPLEKAQFEVLASKVSELDMKSSNPRAAMQEAGIGELGNVRSTDGTSEWDKDWQGLIRQDGVNLPKIIERPEAVATEEARRNRTYGKVRLSALINKNGGLQDIKVEKGLGHGLDERAVQSIRNSWVFLPATKNGEVIEGGITFDVEFPPPTAKKP